MNTPDTEWENELHMKALAKAECAKDAGELTVVKLGYVVSLMKEVQDERDTYWKERVRKEVEKTKADWLRSEIEKLEGVRRDFIARWEHPESGLALEHTVKSETIYTLTSIITRYKEELLELEKGV